MPLPAVSPDIDVITCRRSYHTGNRIHTDLLTEFRDTSVILGNPTGTKTNLQGAEKCQRD